MPGISITPATPGIIVAAFTGKASVSATASASCALSAPLGRPGTSPPAVLASVIMAAPVSPFVNGVYPVTCQATMEFGAWGATRERLWRGGQLRTMYVETKPAGE
jgi:hypothetical protein